MSNITFLELQDAVILGRFNSGDRATVKAIINDCEETIWNAQKWDFRYVSGSDVATVGVTNGVYSLAPPVDFQEALYLYDDTGESLEQLSQRAWELRYLPDVASGAKDKPEAFAIVNRKILLGPIPNASYSFKLSYLRRLYHYVAAGTLTQGPMSGDTDYPAWESEHHRILVPMAKMVLIGENAGDDYLALERVFDKRMAAMLSDHLPDHGGVLQHGMAYNY